MTAETRAKSGLTGEAAATHPVSLRRRWIFRLLAVLFGLGVIPAVEGLFRWWDIGSNVNLIIPAAAFGPEYSHQLNGLVDLPYYGQTDLAGPELRPFALPKPEDTYRIIFLGASTVIGFPYPPELAFPRQVELQLIHQNPGVKFEVLNVGITALNSFSVADLLEQSIEAEPDLIVVHAGHNEFYGPGGPASTASGLPSHLQNLSFHLRRCRMVRLIAEAADGHPALDDDVINVLPAQLQIPLNGPVFEHAAGNFRRNLQQMARSCRRRKIPLLLSTVACNLRDQSPILAEWPTGASTFRKAEWQELMTEATRLIRVLQFKPALAVLEKAGDICSDHALLQFRFGQCYAGLSRHEEAYVAFQRARDLDGCRFRAPSLMAGIVRQTAQQQPDGFFLDVAEILRTSAVDPAGPGNELFLEHVHYNTRGHQVLGRMFAEFIQTNCLGRRWSSEKVPDESTMLQLIGYIPEDELSALLNAIQLLQTRTFSGTADGSEQVESLGTLVSKVWESIPFVRQQAYAKLTQEQVQTDLIGHLIAQHTSAKNLEVVNELRVIQRRRQPWRFQK